jgi:nucleotide-binding universal stress UspA family protein
MFEKILVAIDHTEFSHCIFEQSLMLAKLHQSELMLVHVLTPSESFYPAGNSYLGLPAPPLTEYLQQLQEWEQQGIAKLQAFTTEAIAAGVKTGFKQTVGNPGKSICEVAKDWNASLIIIGRRGLSGLSEMFIGSQSNYVLHHAPCNVLAIQISERCLT